ncbi:amidohydrolase [Spongisporangium articulatum]|uniref:Amidohydrolase n=1 Tax=Spongisporangium articulatum TaxID=3362603 RepID=A0ABW8AP92_9ACTN
MPADLIVSDARIWTGDAATPWAEALAVSGDRVVAVGPADDVAALAGPRTRRVEAPGRLVVPGFHDAHVHPSFGGRFRLTCDLHEVSGLAAVLGAVRAYARAHPDRPWVYGSGWEITGLDGVPPSAALLDDVVPDRPVFLLNASVHEAWVNTAALRRAGITADTPDPAGGWYERDGDGTPTGRLYEGAAYAFEARFVPGPTPVEREAALLVAQEFLHSLGITGWQDAWVTPELLSAYEDLADDGRLTARVSAALWWERTRGLEQIDGFVAARGEAGGRERLVVRTVKIMLDGVVENHSAAMLAPYLHVHDGDHAGRLYVEPGVVTEAVTRLDALGFQVHFHALGDRAVRVGLDAVEVAAARNGSPGANRHTLAHLQVVHPDDVARFAALGAVPNCQALWAQYEPPMTELTLPFLGPERSAQQYPFGSLAAAGARLAMGSDWPVSTPAPLAQIDVAVHRSEHGAAAPFLPEEALTLEQALTAFTAGSAFACHDDDAGVLRAGSRADLAVLSSDLFAASDLAEALAETRVELTVAAGRVVHQDR